MCRNTRVFTEWVLSGWFSLFCSGQNTGNGLRLPLKGWVRGKGCRQHGGLCDRESPGSSCEAIRRGGSALPCAGDLSPS